MGNPQKKPYKKHVFMDNNQEYAFLPFQSTKYLQ